MDICTSNRIKLSNVLLSNFQFLNRSIKFHYNIYHLFPKNNFSNFKHSMQKKSFLIATLTSTNTLSKINRVSSL